MPSSMTRVGRSTSTGARGASKATCSTRACSSESIEGVTHLAHLAASVGVGQSMTNIVDYTRNNVMTAAIMLETLSRKPHGIERIAVASSMSIYGEGAYCAPVTAARRLSPGSAPTSSSSNRQWELVEGNETLTPLPTTEDKLLQPASIYAVNKRDHEEMFLSVGRALGIPTVALRLFNAYGSRQALSNPYTGVAAIFISRLLNDQPPLIFEDGEQRRDFVHVADVADAFATVLDSDRCVWDAFNVGSGTPITVTGMAQVLARLLRKNIAPEIMNKYRVGDIRHCFADISKIERVFGFRPRRSFEAGMNELIDWVATAKAPVNRSQESLAELQRQQAGRLGIDGSAVRRIGHEHPFHELPSVRQSRAAQARLWQRQCFATEVTRRSLRPAAHVRHRARSTWHPTFSASPAYGRGRSSWRAAARCASRWSSRRCFLTAGSCWRWRGTSSIGGREDINNFVGMGEAPNWPNKVENGELRIDSGTKWNGTHYYYVMKLPTAARPDVMEGRWMSDRHPQPVVLYRDKGR